VFWQKHVEREVSPLDGDLSLDHVGGLMFMGNIILLCACVGVCK
jgi:hypothetical protein